MHKKKLWAAIMIIIPFTSYGMENDEKLMQQTLAVMQEFYQVIDTTTDEILSDDDQEQLSCIGNCVVRRHTKKGTTTWETPVYVKIRKHENKEDVIHRLTRLSKAVWDCNNTLREQENGTELCKIIGQQLNVEINKSHKHLRAHWEFLGV